MNPFIFAGFAIVSITSAARVDTSAARIAQVGDQDFLGNSEDQGVLVDVTKGLLKIESSVPKPIRCCCDSISAGLGHLFDNHKRSGQCHIFTYEKAFKCGDVVRPAWLKHSGNLNHFKTCKDARCLVPEEEAEQFYRTFGTADNYCNSFKVDKTSAGAVALGKDTTVTCDAGYKPQVEHVTCMWKSIQEGIFDPMPECMPDQEWCPTVEIPQVLGVAATQLGASSPVTCAPGLEPVHKESTCTTDKVFKPTPECKPIPNYCKFQSYHMGPSVRPAAKNEWVPIQCSPGLAPESEMTQCTERGTFEPRPYCSKVWDFCKSITTKPEPGQVISPGPAVNSAALGISEMVRCRIGWEAQPAQVKCTESGNFDQEPKCIKNWSWCSSYEEGDTYVQAAARDELRTVQCSHRDYKPAMEYVKCEKNRQFNPTPACVLK